MAQNPAKKAIVRALIEGTLTDLMVKTTSDQVYVDATTTLAAKLAEIVTTLGQKADSTQVATDISSAVSAAVDGIIDGAPGTYDTLKEIADYIADHVDVVSALNAAIGAKADATTVTALDTALTALTTRVGTAEGDIDAVEGRLDTVESKITTLETAKTRIYYSASQPANLTANDVWFQLIDDEPSQQGGE